MEFVPLSQKDYIVINIYQSRRAYIHLFLLYNKQRVLGIAGPKKALKASATTGKSARFYPADDIKTPKPSRKSKKNVSLVIKCSMFAWQ